MIDPLSALFAIAIGWLFCGVVNIVTLYLYFLVLIPLRGEADKGEGEAQAFFRGGFRNFLVTVSCSLIIGPCCIWFMLGNDRRAARERLRERLNRGYSVRG